MRFHRLRARDFRNFEMIEAVFGEGSQFIHGSNGQGKTNLLEALGLVTSLRSFRTTDLSNLIRWEAPDQQAALVYEITHETLGETRLEIQFRKGLKRVLLEGNPVHKLSEMLGLFPTISFSSQDIQILRGAPSLRRRLMDMMFVMMDAEYYAVLARYFRALKARNALLKKRASEAHRRSFEEILMREGYDLARRRTGLLHSFSSHFQRAYEEISGLDEQPQVIYAPSIEAGSETDYEKGFLRNQKRDLELGSTQAGPHRDELDLRLLGHPARDYGSEGQQRGMVLALRFGLLDWYREQGGSTPVILADDIVGELDAGRRKGFWKMLGEESQVIATGTRYPDDDFHQWNIWEMNSGVISPSNKESLQ